MGSYAFSRSHPKAKPGTNNGTLQIFRERSEERSETTPVWIHQVESDFGITGSFGQSVGKRDFYPRNFNQPSYRFYGQTHNENEYGDLCEFIRRGQLESIFGGASGTTPILMRIKLPVAGVTMTWVGRGRRSRVKRRINRNLKGERPPIWLEGYVRNIKRRHERFVNAPEYQFDFIVVKTLAGPFEDEVVESRTLRSWDVYLNSKGGGIIQDPDAALPKNSTPKSGPSPTPPAPPWIAPDDLFEDPNLD